MPIQVIGAGFGRTGTTSLKEGLELLGYGKCHHMTENRLWMIKHWAAKADDDSYDMPWEEIFEEFGAAVDWPSASYYKELAEKYPDAKVILTVRDPEAWHRSVMETIYAIATYVPWFATIFGPFKKMLMKGIWERHFQNRVADKEHAIKCFNEHTAEVKRTIPADRLLVFNVKQGWEPLCEFLGKPVPSTPFPHSNEAAVLKRVARLFRVIYYLNFAIPAAAAVYAWWKWW